MAMRHSSLVLLQQYDYFLGGECPHPSAGVSKRPLIWPFDFDGAAARNFGVIGTSDGVSGSTNGGNGILRDSASPRAQK